MRVSGVHHVALWVHDLQGACDFYRGVLGLTEQRRWHTEAGDLRSIWLEAGSTILMLERAPEGQPPPAPGPGWRLAALAIDARDRQGWLDRLRDHGVPVADTTAYSIYVDDPEGNRVALSHWPDR